MHIAAMSVSFHLEGCGSLKEKRGRLRGLKDRFGKISNLAVAEVDHHDQHHSAEWLFVAVTHDRVQAEKLFASIQNYVNAELDAVVANTQVEWL